MSFEPDLWHEVSQFLYREARLQDTHQYDAWEALWHDEAVYWVPAGGDDTDPEQSMSIIYDNRSRIALRVRQLNTGRRHAQTPRSRLLRTISNIELVAVESDRVTATANAVVHESNRHGETVWASRNEYLLSRIGGDWRMRRKKVVLVNNDKPLLSLSFLI